MRFAVCRINESELEAKNALLAEAMNTLQQTEKKLKVVEEDFNRKHEELEKLRLELVERKSPPQISEAGCQTASSGCDSSSSKQLSLEQQVISVLYSIHTYLTFTFSLQRRKRSTGCLLDPFTLQIPLIIASLSFAKKKCIHDL